MPSSSTPSRVTGDLSGGFASAVKAVTGNVTAGMIAFAPLGLEYVETGIVAGMLSSIVGCLLASLSGSAPGMITGPKFTTSVVFAALLSQLMATGQFDARPELLVSLAFSAVMVSGSVQMLLGAFRVGGLVKFMPYPVVAGIRNTTALLLISSQLWALIGVEREPGAEAAPFLDALSQTQPATLLVAAVTALVAWKGVPFVAKSAAPVVALLVGTGLYHLLDLLIPGVRLGAHLPRIEPFVPSPDYLVSVFSGWGSAASLEVVSMVIAGGLAMAVLDSLSALITLVTYQSIADRRFDANRQLMGQGIGTVASSVFGGLTTSGILARAVVNYESGGRTRASGVVSAVFVLLLVIALGTPLSWMPSAAIAGLIMVIATRLFDRWTVGQLKEALRPEAEDPRDNWTAVGLMTLVVAIGLAKGLVAAVGAGVALSVVIFVIQMSRSPIRRVRTGSTVRSARRRDQHLTELLAAHGDRIAVIELEGMIFFGSCDSVATEAESFAEGGVEYMLLDLKRVAGVDPSGYKALGQTWKSLNSRGCNLAFSHVVPGQVNKEIAEDLVLNGVPVDRMFESEDLALEFFEDELLTRLGADQTTAAKRTVADFGEAWGLDPDECLALEKYMETRVFEAGDFVFREGDTSRSLYLLSSGTADVTIPIGEGRRRRLAAFQQGTFFGELALLDGEPRTAGVKATGHLELFELTYEAFDRLHTEEHVTAMKIQTAIGRVLGARLRGANQMISDLDS